MEYVFMIQIHTATEEANSELAFGWQMWPNGRSWSAIFFDMFIAAQ
jgi:hypothetical protein